MIVYLARECAHGKQEVHCSLETAKAAVQRMISDDPNWDGWEWTFDNGVWRFQPNGSTCAEGKIEQYELLD